MSLFRACGGWPSGVWIDGDRQAVPDGSSFAWQHWSHTFSYALTSSGAAGDWREAGFNAAAEEYNHDLTAVVTGPTQLADKADRAGLLSVEGAPNVTLSALKPFGNPLAAGRPGTPSAGSDGRLVTMRLRETDGRPAVARLRMADGIEAAWRTDLLEELTEHDSPQLAAPDGVVSVPLAPFETVTVAVRPGSATSRLSAAAAAAPGRPGGAAGAGPAGLRPLLAAREGTRPGRQCPGRGALRADQDHAQRRCAAGPGDAVGGVRARARHRDG